MVSGHRWGGWTCFLDCNSSPNLQNGKTYSKIMISLFVERSRAGQRPSVQQVSIQDYHLVLVVLGNIYKSVLIATTVNIVY